MGNLADESGTDVEMYRRARNPDTIHVISRSDAPEELLTILDNAGLERKTTETTGPVYVWHETPEGLSEKAQKQLATRAMLPLLIADYDVNYDDGVYDVTAWAQAVAEHRAQQAKGKITQAPAGAPPGPPSAPPRSR
ncbi:MULTISPECIES: hypothetical protein [Streptomyces]|uniref:hypothetical protein n=1 Tax=Streptomyces TaxID=1883 RepID=UPI0022717A55|nr:MULTISPECIES: hypothetical protein [unclassified Streptomyces]MCY0940251.1 hypothetical protein [Streptomyces sp. H34-AA3]MCZ4080898.1 hypothetical protein [Streptomyces sp. H34-S5]